MRGRSAVGWRNRGMRGRSAVGRRGRGVREDATPGRRDGSAHLSAFARRTRTAKAPTAQRTALFIAPSLSSDTSAPGAHADASGKTPTLLPICPRPRSACGCVGQALQPYCRHAPDPGAHADASGKLPNLIADMPPPPERMRMRPPKPHSRPRSDSPRPPQDPMKTSDRMARPDRKAGPPFPSRPNAPSS